MDPSAMNSFTVINVNPEKLKTLKSN
jgi:hypothetical protein